MGMIEESELSGLGRWVREHRNDPLPTSTASPRLSSRRTRFRKLRRVGDLRAVISLRMR